MGRFARSARCAFPDGGLRGRAGLAVAALLGAVSVPVLVSVPAAAAAVDGGSAGQPVGVAAPDPLRDQSVGAPTDLTTDTFTVCVSGASRPFARPPSKLSARVSSQENSVRARFEWWALGGHRLGRYVSPFSASGTTFTATVPEGSFEDGASYAWRVRAETETDASEWSGWCEFTVDNVRPVVPVVSSQDFPENELGPAVGTPGTFTFGPGESTDVVAYRYGLNVDASALPDTVAVPLGGSATVTVVPDRFVNWLNVRSVDRAGNLSDVRTYFFYAVTEPVPPQPPALTGQWKLDELSGTTAADASGNGHPGTLIGGASWTAGHAGNAVDLDGTTGYVTTAAPVVRTDGSFTVAAWVRTSAVGPAAVAVSQSGVRANGFALGYSTDPYYGTTWSFGAPASDADGAAYDRARDVFDAVEPGTWTHLVGVYDAGRQEVSLYVNGQFVDATAHTTPWNASGSLLIGRGLIDGTPQDFWPGALDDVRVYTGVLSYQDIYALYQS
jgi:hypothetical protein